MGRRYEDVLELAAAALASAQVLCEVAQQRQHMGRDFKKHSMARRTEFRCPEGKRRDPDQNPSQKRSKCIPARKALGGSSKMIRLKKYMHRRWISGTGHAEDRMRKRWHDRREPLLKAQKQAGESLTMRDFFDLMEAEG